MKRFLLIISMILITNASLNAQSIKKNEVDKFTGLRIIETSSKTLYSQNRTMTGYTHKFDFAIRKVNDTYAIVANILMDDIVKYTEDDGVIFLLENNEKVSLKTRYTGIGTDSFANGYYFSTVFRLTEEDVALLKKYKITDVRVTYFGGHYDKTLPENKRNLMQKMLYLFD
jgi:hypothetical protein